MPCLFCCAMLNWLCLKQRDSLCVRLPCSLLNRSRVAHTPPSLIIIHNPGVWRSKLSFFTFSSPSFLSDLCTCAHPPPTWPSHDTYKKTLCSWWNKNELFCFVCLRLPGRWTQHVPLSESTAHFSSLPLTDWSGLCVYTVAPPHVFQPFPLRRNCFA